VEAIHAHAAPALVELHGGGGEQLQLVQRRHEFLGAQEGGFDRAGEFVKFSIKKI
jgi:hypothetical protein